MKMLFNFFRSSRSTHFNALHCPPRDGAASHRSAGFTLLEVMIAIGILAIGIGAILVAENNSLDVTLRAKRMNTVAMLAKNALIEAERLTEGKTFTEVNDDQSGKFDAPYTEYSWERKIKEITFPNLMDPSQANGGNAGGEAGAASAAATPEGSGAIDQNVEKVVKLATNYLSKSTREITVTIKWKDKGEDQKFSVSQYWVDLNHEFNMNDE
jgi:general secretion pathway protein I